jgi:hypothetical protein
MDQVSDKDVMITLDMRLLDQYRVRHNKHAKAEDLIKLIAVQIDSIILRFREKKRKHQIFWLRLKSMKIQLHITDFLDRDEKREIRISVNSPETSKIFNLADLKNKIFEDSLFGHLKTENVDDEKNETKICNSTEYDYMRTGVHHGYSSYKKRGRRKQVY